MTSPLTAEEADRLFAERTLGDHGEEPVLEAQKRGQLVRVLDRIDLDTSGEPDLTFPDLVEVSGPMLAGQLWVTLARPEMGKTTLALNVARRWLEQPKPIGFAYFGTEEATDTQQLRFAAILSGNPAPEVVAGQWERIGGPDAKKEVQRALYEINQGKFKDLAYFAEETRPRLGDIRRAAKDAVRMGLPVLILDHFHRMAVEETRDMVATREETVRRIKELAVQEGIRILMFGQARRAGENSLARFMPPTAESGKGTSALEEEADVLMGLFKPLGRWSEDMHAFKPLTKGDRDAFERGDLQASDVLLPNTMGVKMLKHRRNGDYSGRIIKLHCERGLVVPHSNR